MFYPFFPLYRKEILSLDKLEAQLKACNCRLIFSKAKVSQFLAYIYLYVIVSILNLKNNLFFSLFFLVAIYTSFVPSQFGS